MSVSALSEPFILSTYNTTSRGKKSEIDAPGAYVSGHRTDRSEEYVTVAVHADGIHILDVDNLHPVLSNTLGPSCSFWCPPLSIPSSSKHKWMTYVVGALPSDPSTSDVSKRTIWTWKSDGRSSESSPQSQTILSEGKSIKSLQGSPDLPDRIVCFSSEGAICVLDAYNLQTRAVLEAECFDRELLDAWLFSREQSSFGDRQRGALVILLLSETTASVKLRVLAIDEADSISQLQEQDIPVTKIASVACSNSGCLSILQTDGSWTSYQLSCTLPFEPESSLQLSNFPFCKSPPPTSPAVIPRVSSISTTALTSSHILVASLLSGQQIILQIWDLRFSVLLASHTLSVPSSLSNADTLHLNLASGAEVLVHSLPHDAISSQSYLTISSVPSFYGKSAFNEANVSTSDNRTTTVVFVVPHTVPKVSTLAAAMGRGSITKRWISNNSAGSSVTTTSKDGTADNSSSATTERRKMLSNLNAALKCGRPEAAVAIFMKWAPKSMDDVSRTTSPLDYNFVKVLLESLLAPSGDKVSNSTEASATYAPDITRWLLEQRVVSSVMLAPYGGILSLLRAKGDWQSIELAFTCVLDLTEVEIVETLRVILAHQRQSLAPSLAANAIGDSDAMQVDLPGVLSTTSSSDSITSLAAYLSLVASYPTSRLPLLLALRRYLQDPEDVTSVIKILSEWVGRSAKLEMEMGESRKLMPSKKDLKKTAEGVWVVTGRREKGNSKERKLLMPALERLTSLIQIIFDASFLTLLSHKPSHWVLTKLVAQLSSEMAFAQAAQGLLGALEPFALVQQKAISDSLIPRKEKEKEKRKQDWRQRRNRAGKPGSADIGVYSLEELTF